MKLKMELSYHIKGHLMKKLNLILCAILSVHITYTVQAPGVYILGITNRTNMDIRHLVDSETGKQGTNHCLEPTDIEAYPLLVSNALSKGCQTFQLTERRTNFNQHLLLARYTIFLSLQSAQSPHTKRHACLTAACSSGSLPEYLTPMVDPIRDIVQWILKFYNEGTPGNRIPKCEFQITQGPNDLVGAPIYAEIEPDYDDGSDDDETLLQ